MKMKPKRLIVLIIASVITAFFGFKIFQDIETDPKSGFVYGYIFVIMGILVAAATIKKSKQYIVDHPRTIRVAGVIVGSLGILLIAAGIVAAVRNSPWIASDIGVWASLAPIFLGFMIYRLPEIATPKREITDFIEWTRK